jgi:hypothetical protein
VNLRAPRLFPLATVAAVLLAPYPIRAQALSFLAMSAKLQNAASLPQVTPSLDSSGPLTSQQPAGSGSTSSPKKTAPVTGAAPLPNAPDPQSEYHYTPLTIRDRWHAYLFDSFGPVALTRAAVGASILQWRKSPPDWGEGAAGFGDRMASQYGLAMLDYSAQFGFGTLLHQDMKYYRCACSGFFAKIRHATLMTLEARSSTDGHHIFSLPKLLSPYAATFGELMWYPPRYGPKDALRQGNYNLLGNFGINAAREFFHFLLLKSKTDSP